MPGTTTTIQSGDTKDTGNCLFNTTLQPKSPLKICEILSQILTDLSKSVRIWLKLHRYFNWWKYVVVLIINILLRRVEFGFQTPQKNFNFHLASPRENFKFFCGVRAKFQTPLSAEGCFCQHSSFALFSGRPYLVSRWVSFWPSWECHWSADA